MMIELKKGVSVSVSSIVTVKENPDGHGSTVTLTNGEVITSDMTYKKLMYLVELPPSPRLGVRDILLG